MVKRGSEDSINTTLIIITKCIIFHQQIPVIKKIKSSFFNGAVNTYFQKHLQQPCIYQGLLGPRGMSYRNQQLSLYRLLPLF